MVEVDTAAAAVEVADVGAFPVVDLAASDLAAVHLHQGGVEDVAVLARAEDAALDGGTGVVAFFTYNNARYIDVGQVVVALAGGAAAGAEDTAVVAALAALASLHLVAVAAAVAVFVIFVHRAYDAAGDLHPGAAAGVGVFAGREAADVALLELEAVVGAVGRHGVIGAHRGHRAAAEEGVAHPAAGHQHVGVAVDAAGRPAEAVDADGVDAAAAAVDVATEDGARGVAVDGGQRVGLLKGVADDAAADGDHRAVEHMAVGAAAEDAAHDGSAGQDVDVGVIHIGQMGHLGGVLARDTAAAAEDGALIPAHAADDAAADVDGGDAGGVLDGVRAGHRRQRCAVGEGGGVAHPEAEDIEHLGRLAVGVGVVGAHRG